MPIYNWIKILETGDLKWLFVRNKGRVSSRSQEHWMKLQQEYLDEFGLDEQYKQRLRLTQKLTNLNLDFVLTDIEGKHLAKISRRAGIHAY